MGKGRFGAVLVLVALGSATTACSQVSSKPSAASSTAIPKTWSLVALGDSVPRGANCDCTPYPQLSADGLMSDSGQAVMATNDAVSGYTTSNVLKQLTSNGDVIGHVRKADIVEIEIGANDVPYTASCGTAVDCYAREIPPLEKNLAEIVSRVRRITGHGVLVVLLDYWSVWLGGQYAAAKGDSYVRAAEQVTADVNEVIKSTAATSGSSYVDLRAAFKGPDYSYDETHYLSSDGDHPNAAGHEQIATATVAVIEKALHI